MQNTQNKVLNLINCLLLMSDGKKRTLATIAFTLDISKRTALRYINDLEYIGLFFDRSTGKNGGIVASENYLKNFIQYKHLHGAIA